MNQRSIGDAVSPVLIDLGLELDAVEIVPAGKRRLVRVIVDGDGPAGRGPDLDEIAAATKAISNVLDESGVTGETSYTLEVSSRGVGRPLVSPAHWRRNTGRLVEVATPDGTITGRIVETDEDHVTVDVDGHRESFGYHTLGRALVQIEFNRRVDED